MRTGLKNNLMKLDKEKLVEIIATYDHVAFRIGETLVDESKGYIDSSKAIEKIRAYMDDLPSIRSMI